MNCEQCEDQLLELLYGELPAQEATLVQSHADDCQTCLAALDELKDAMGYANAFAFDEPPASFDMPIMEAARSHVLREERIAHIEQTNEKTTLRDDTRESVPFWTWLRGLMTGPQFAATGAMIAIVGLSIWMLREQTMQGDTAMTVEPNPMQVPAAEAVEMEQGEFADKLAEEKAQAEDVFEQSAALPDSPEPTQAKDSMRSVDGRNVRARRARAAERKSIPMKKNNDPLGGLAGGADIGSGAQRSNGYAPSSTMTKGATEATPSAPESYNRRANAPLEESEKAEAAAADDEGRVVTTAYNRGINLYEARKYAEAARAFEQALVSRDARRGDALFYLARSYRERGDCARAINPYQAFLRENPKDGRVSTAQRELNDCEARIEKSNSSKAKRAKPEADLKPSAL